MNASRALFGRSHRLLLLLQQRRRPAAFALGRCFAAGDCLESRDRLLLGLAATGAPITPAELRDAYYAACKLCHPDMQPSGTKKSGAEAFLAVTDSYERLRDAMGSDGTSAHVMELDEETEYGVKSKTCDRVGMSSACLCPPARPGKRASG